METSPAASGLGGAYAGRATTDGSVAGTQAWFGPRAAGWEAGPALDGPALGGAVAYLVPEPGVVVLDVGCGTGRALSALRAAVGPAGAVIGVDVTPEMLAVARSVGRMSLAALALGDARSLPLADAVVDAVLGAGLLLPRLPHPGMVLAELARVTKPSGRLAAFHPRRGAPRGSSLDPEALASLLVGAGWEPLRVNEAAGRCLALAIRR